MKKILIFFLVLCFIYSCSEDKHNFRVKGNIKGSPPNMIYLLQLTEKGTVRVDSSEINNNGEFKLKGKTSIPSFYVLKAGRSRGITLVVYPKDKIQVFANSENFEIDYVVEGSAESKRISKLIKEQDNALQKITNLSNKFETAINSPDFLEKKAKIDSVYFAVINQHKKFSVGFIKEDPCSFASLMALYQQFGRMAPLFDIKNDFKLFEDVDSCLASLYPTSDAVKSLNKKVVETREYIKIGIGSVAPDISLPDTANQLISLNSLRGKYVLLNFWASWCTECTQQTELLKGIYKKYKSKGFEVYQVSLDKTSESWKLGIKESNLPWINVSDLKYWNSDVVKKYYLNKIPLNILLDTEGRIIEKEKSLSEIDVKLSEIFK